MIVLRYFLLFVEIVTCFLLVGAILLQRAKSQGAGLAFGAGVGESLFGAQAGTVLTKTTVILAIIFLVNTTILSLLGSSVGRPQSIADRIDTVPSAMPNSMPSAGGGAPGPAAAVPSPAMPMPDQPSAPLSAGDIQPVAPAPVAPEPDVPAAK